MNFKKFSIISGIFLLMACGGETEKLSQMEEYDGPSLESSDVVIEMSEGALLKLVVTGNKQLTYKNGDLSFPETITVHFFNPEGDTTSVLTAQKGEYSAETKLYKATGDVVVSNLEKKQTLSTEELFWEPEKDRIFTERFFIIVTDERLIKGEGLEAPQDFSSYQIKNPRDSEFIIKDSNENN
ncbi:MAG: LPS export ABC transporter protein LptC [Roseivirga sp.]|jgi:LPS export ABC transporter protein LptC